MNFRDRWEVDANGEKFIFTVELQRSLSRAGLPIEPASLPELRGFHWADVPRGGQGQQVKYETEKTSRSEEFDAPSTIQIDPQTGKYIGRMKWYNARKGYGFIMRGGGEEIFFHKSNTTLDPNELQEGQWILYDVEETRKGPEATDVEPYAGDVDA